MSAGRRLDAGAWKETLSWELRAATSFSAAGYVIGPPYDAMAVLQAVYDRLQKGSIPPDRPGRKRLPNELKAPHRNNRKIIGGKIGRQETFAPPGVHESALGTGPLI